MSVDQCWRLASAWFYSKMNPDWRRATLEEIEALLDGIGLTGPFWSLR